MSTHWRRAFAICLAALLASAGSGLAQEEAEEEVLPRWTDTAEFSLLMTSGNSEAESIALRNTLTRHMENATFSLDAGAFRAETTTSSRLAVGDGQNFTVVENSSTALTAENYFLRGRYDRKISERLFWFAGLGWDRNEFAGIENRTSAVGGVGHVWFDDENRRFRTDYGVTFTDQEDLVGTSDSFGGIRLSYDYWRKLTATAGFASVLIVDQNIDDSSDLRADFTNWVSAALSDRMALKVSLQALYDNQPSLGLVPLFTPTGVPTGDVVLLPLDDLDTILTASLVVSF